MRQLIVCLTNYMSAIEVTCSQKQPFLTLYYYRKQETIATEREEIERQRKLLAKRKPSTAQPKGRANNGPAVAVANGDFAKPDPPKE